MTKCRLCYIFEVQQENRKQTNKGNNVTNQVTIKGVTAKLTRTGNIWTLSIPEGHTSEYKCRYSVLNEIPTLAWGMGKNPTRDYMIDRLKVYLEQGKIELSHLGTLTWEYLYKD